MMMPGGNESIPSSPLMKDMLMYPWNWGMGAQKIQVSPSPSAYSHSACAWSAGSLSCCRPSPSTSSTFDDSSEQADALVLDANCGRRRTNSFSSFNGFGSPTSSGPRPSPRRPLQNIPPSPRTPQQAEQLQNIIPPSPRTPQQSRDDADNLLNSKRGRPRADSITSLIVEASQSPSSIRCKKCRRVFPREKSLQAHMRTHTGERPYICDYPGCERAFCQSGQLNTHQRLHTGEKPFQCSATGCENRFTHANRHCQAHPGTQLMRTDPNVMYPCIPQDENNIAILEWLNRHVKRRQDTASNPRQVKRALNVDTSLSDQNTSTENQEPGVKRLKVDDEEDVSDICKIGDDEMAEPLDLSNKTIKTSHLKHCSENLLLDSDEKISLDELDSPSADSEENVSQENERETILGALALMEFAKNGLLKGSNFRL